MDDILTWVPVKNQDGNMGAALLYMGEIALVVYQDMDSDKVFTDLAQMDGSFLRVAENTSIDAAMSEATRIGLAAFVAVEKALGE